jgi:hypothetical protein
MASVEVVAHKQGRIHAEPLLRKVSDVPACARLVVDGTVRNLF